MKRGEVWWAKFPGPAGERPVLLLSRNEAYQVRKLVTIAPVTTRIRNLPVEVLLGKPDGLPKSCVVNLDTITTIPKQNLTKCLCLLSKKKARQVNEAVFFALGLE